jgi:transposase
MATRRKRKRKTRPRGALSSKRFSALNKRRKAKMKKIENLRAALVPIYSRLAAGSFNPQLLKVKTYKV